MSKIQNNISLFLGPDFHHVIYPVNLNGDLNFIAIMKYNLSTNEQKNYSLFNDKNFIKTIKTNSITLPSRDKQLEKSQLRANFESGDLKTGQYFAEAQFRGQLLDIPSNK